MENQICIFSTWLEHEAILLRDKLELEGIKTTLLNKRDSTYNTFGSIELFVNPDDEKRAKELIEKTNE